MDHLTSPKLTLGVHCLNIRHKGMFVTSGPDPDEFTFYDRYDSTGVLVRRNAARLRSRRRAGAARLLHRRARLLQALTTAPASPQPQPQP